MNEKEHLTIILLTKSVENERESTSHNHSTIYMGRFNGERLSFKKINEVLLQGYI